MTQRHKGVEVPQPAAAARNDTDMHKNHLLQEFLQISLLLLEKVLGLWNGKE